jgi:glutathione synthase/RimK-type ligase-like ATP-grasp enzyme
MIEMGRRSSEIMADLFDCAFVACDIVGNENGSYVIETNPACPDMNFLVEQIDDRYNKGESVARACLKKLESIN